MKRIIVALLTACFSLAAMAAEPVNINSATAEEIAENLKGIGMSKAQKIIDYRESNGGFLHVDELVNVQGIGIRTVDQNRGMILLQDAADDGVD